MRAIADEAKEWEPHCRVEYMPSDPKRPFRVTLAAKRYHRKDRIRSTTEATPEAALALALAELRMQILVDEDRGRR